MIDPSDEDGPTAIAAVAADGLYRAAVPRGEGRQLYLFSRSARSYRLFEGLPSVAGGSAHFRQHPLTGEWISYSAVRQGRTFLPQAAECPLCAMTSDGLKTDIPVDDYEVAIFTNRFAALTAEAGPPPEMMLATRPGTGVCEVVSYSADHQASLSTVGPDRIALLLDALAIRCTELMANADIAYVMPFENRGREIGVTLDHPHGQIYALPHVPDRIKRAADTFCKDDPLAGLAHRLPEQLVLAKNNSGIAFVPPWARYPFEIWIAPHQQVAELAALDSEARADMAALVSIAAGKLDAAFDAPMPYTFAWQMAPRGYADSFHLHAIFQPLKRAADKMKYLASVEQFTGFFLVDLLPEAAADILNRQDGQRG
jgi:UDPglucose--hexose-1-phosphate uridylyltransferase